MSNKVFTLFNALIISFWLSNVQVSACTNLLVTRGASANGSVMITYAADSHIRYGYLFHYPAADYNPGNMLSIYHYENGKLLGKIPEVAHTYSVIGFMNEHQVAIGETTFGGLDSLQAQPGAILDYGSLMKIALQRSRTAREAIKVITELVENYGYASSGESLSISDAREAWIMEIIGKGKCEKGAVWVALMIPDGYVSGHANQARITTFPIQKVNNWTDSKQTCYHSPDVIMFARKRGWFKGKDAEFSFSDTYAPVSFSGARACDSRVWSFFRKFNSQIRDNNGYTDYVLGKIKHEAIWADGSSNANGYATNRLPLWVKPDQLITFQDVMTSMRDHFEGTPLDMTNDVGAGPFNAPYRWRPMDFKVNDTTYCNERAIATQQTGYSFVAQSRSELPNPIGGIFWFGVDDTDGCVYAPMYCGIAEIPEVFAEGNGSMISWNDKSAFWTFNLVNNWAYTRYNLIHPEIELYQKELEDQYINETATIDAQASLLYKDNRADAIKFITQYSVNTGNTLVNKWNDFFHYLFMKYMDGNLKQTNDRKLLDNGNGKGIPPRPSHPGYGKDWEERVAKETGNRYKVTH